MKQAERKYIASTLTPDLDNANVGSETDCLYAGNTLGCFPFFISVRFFLILQLKRSGFLENAKTSLWSNSMIWFGAGVSIAEILTGTLIAPLGFKMGLISIVSGHIIGCILLYLAGIIGAKTGKSAMETVKNSFGQKGSLLFSVLNVLQLIGWTAVMILSGASAAGSIIPLGGTLIWSLIIGALILLWTLIGLKNLGKINTLAMGLLFILTIMLSVVIFRSSASFTPGDMSFGLAMELSVAMPLSWLPLISDYTKNAEKPEKAAAVSAITYFFVSCWMYIIGLGAAIFTGQSDISGILMTSGLGIASIMIIIFSTVTTTFLDVYSAGVSSVSISSKLKEKPAAIAVCILGTALAMFTPMSQFESFLYLISSVFAPMIAILIVDFFILKKDHSGDPFNTVNIIVWAAGFLIYRRFLLIDTPIGSTLPVMFITAMLCLIINKITGGKSNDEKNVRECS